MKTLGHSHRLEWHTKQQHKKIHQNWDALTQHSTTVVGHIFSVPAWLKFKFTVIPPKLGWNGEKSSNQKTPKLLAVNSAFIRTLLNYNFYNASGRPTAWVWNTLSCTFSRAVRRGSNGPQKSVRNSCALGAKVRWRKKCIQPPQCWAQLVCIRQLNYYSRYNNMHYAVSINSHCVLF